jgi:two-component system heavy metal sensor histidine kinase CusS
MLFLSQADRGAVARRVEIDSLSAVAHQVADYHDAALADAGLSVEVEGDAVGAFDVPLLQRALSNLIGNATRYATSGSTVRVLIENLSSDEVSLQVINPGDPIDPKVLPRLFDRFFRADLSRSSAGGNHGLGLSIVAAIARMHGGRPTASSSGGLTAVGMVLKRFNLHHD